MAFGRPSVAEKDDAKEYGESAPMLTGAVTPRRLTQADRKEFEQLVRQKLEVCGAACELCNRGLGDGELAFVLDELDLNPHIRAVDLSSNVLTDGCAKTLALFLQANSSLTHLNLAHNEITARGASVIAAALPFNKTLATLDVRGNMIHTGEGISALMHAMEENPTVTICYEMTGDEEHSGCGCACSIM
eukprot:TRINITY_DN4178_c0_g1_i1.p1 TRINITY_DN4178_c0_g1~~TRINITY_DN4178_c0_g1_i1.p1  ORF type:complete len:189 (+),score=60.73 TRINITY_DN4178_c0_g1_i1:39-605(+)